MCEDAGDLFRAIKAGDLGRLQKGLIANPTLINAQDERWGLTPLMAAIYLRQPAIISRLIAMGTNFSAPLSDPATRVSRYAIPDRSLTRRKYAPNLDIQDLRGRTALIFACKLGFVNVVKQLIYYGAGLDIGGAEGSALYVACTMGHLRLARVLIGKGANINYQTGNGWTPLMTAVDRGHLVVAIMLIEEGVNIELADSRIGTALSLACFQGRLDLATMLIEKGANMDCQSRNGLTPLMWASENGHLAVARMLMDNGANINLESRCGRTALNFAFTSGNFAIAAELERRGG